MERGGQGRPRVAGPLAADHDVDRMVPVQQSHEADLVLDRHLHGPRDVPVRDAQRRLRRGHREDDALVDDHARPAHDVQARDMGVGRRVLEADLGAQRA